MNASKPRILLIDDEPGFTTLLRLNLERAGEFEVSEENDSTRAIETARRLRPDLILLDVVMPGIDGGDLAGHIEKDSVLRHTPIVFMTALIDNRETGGKTIVNDDGHTYLGKPVSLPELLRCIHSHLRPTRSAPRQRRYSERTDYSDPPTTLAPA